MLNSTFIWTLLTCSGPKVRLFLTEDYEFQCQLYGLSGASGMPFQQITLESSLFCSGHHNCLWCYITSSDIKIPLAQQKGRYQSTWRTMESLQADNQSFMSAGGVLNIITMWLMSTFLISPLKMYEMQCTSKNTNIYLHIGLHSWSAPHTWHLQPVYRTRSEAEEWWCHPHWK